MKRKTKVYGPLLLCLVAPILVGACPAENYDYDLNDYVGEWVNDDPDGAVQRMIIEITEQSASGIVVHVKGTCGYESSECDWFSADLFYEPDRLFYEFHAVYENSHANYDLSLLAVPNRDGRREDDQMLSHLFVDYSAANKEDDTWIEGLYRAP